MIAPLLASGLLLAGIPNPFVWLEQAHAERVSSREYRETTSVREKTYRSGRWELTVRRDGFTGEVRCRLTSLKTLSQSRISYAQNALAFELGKDKGTFEARYRIDDGPALTVQSLYPRLAELGALVESGNLENTSGGFVFIPSDDLISAKSVAIRLNEKSAPKLFKLDGFTEAVASAKQVGCDSFERRAW